MLTTSTSDSVCVVTLDRAAARNALSLALLDALADAISSARAARVLILTGSGTAFASGGDLAELRGHETDEMAKRLAEAGRKVCRALQDSPAITIASVNGPAVGGGAELALACDLRVMDDTAYLWFRHARLGVTPAWGTLRRLTSAVGSTQAFAWLALASKIGAAEAARCGLAIRAESGTALAHAQTLASELLQASPHALQLLKESFGSIAAATGGGASDDVEFAAFLQTWTSSDHRDAVEAHFEKRAPSFSAIRTSQP